MPLNNSFRGFVNTINNSKVPAISGIFVTTAKKSSLYFPASQDIVHRTEQKGADRMMTKDEVKKSA